MKKPRSTLFLALTAVSVLFAFRAISDESAADSHNFSAWSGQYYLENEPAEDEAPANFEDRKKYFETDPSISQKVEDYEVDENGNRVEPPAPTEDVTEPTEDKTPETPASPLPLQSYLYYNHGSLKNGVQLEADGKGFLKIFVERNHGWGTRTLVAVIKKLAEDFMTKFPKHERLQIADMSPKNGGKTGHLSHENGNEVDIVYLRNTPREQEARGGYGKNGFAEQFVVSKLVSTKTYKDSKGKKRVSKKYEMKVSDDFNTELNFELLRMADKSAKVKGFFMDKVLIREFFRYADATRNPENPTQNLSDDPEVKTMLAKLSHWPSHADHFHMRLFCQETDTKCVSDVRRAGRSKKKSAKPAAKKAVKA